MHDVCYAYREYVIFFKQYNPRLDDKKNINKKKIEEKDFVDEIKIA